ncbi:MAG: hypothetical protein RDV48_13355 [Candidatus Eremiobacteraeota bacterium]|nr:hypothetical protein [Candidatus Eremiobacteraeota bacterium]
MKYPAGPFLCGVLLAAVLVAALAPSHAGAEEKTVKKHEPVKVSVGSWVESFRNSSRSADFSFIYTQLAYDSVTLRYDQYNIDRRRYWLNIGKIPLLDSKSVKLNYLPGIMVINTALPRAGEKYDRFFYGGHLNLSIPGIGLSVLQKSYAGTEIDFNQTFADLKLCKNLDLSYYLFMDAKAHPDAYLGPKVKCNVGEDSSFHVWYGFSTVSRKPEARMLNYCATFRF